MLVSGKALLRTTCESHGLWQPYHDHISLLLPGAWVQQAHNSKPGIFHQVRCFMITLVSRRGKPGVV